MKPITPGEILLEDYLRPLGLSQNSAAKAMGVAPRVVNEIVLGSRSISPEMSIRLGKFFGQSPQFWFGLQTNCDFRKLKRRERQITARIQPLQRLAAA